MLEMTLTASFIYTTCEDYPGLVATLDHDGGYNAQFEQTPGRLSLRKKIEAQMRVETSCGRKQNQSRKKDYPCVLWLD
ncbi:unnamed protein product [Brassica rapa subsp. trilocularis]